MTEQTVEPEGRWTNVVRGIGLGILVAVVFVLVIAVPASGGADPDD